MIETSYLVKGVQECVAAFDAVEARTAAATTAGVKAVSRRMVVEVRANMDGAPRWRHRGPGVYGYSVNGDGPNHAPRSGGVGKFTGRLRSGVGSKKRIKINGAGEFTGGVGVGGSRMPENNFKKRWETDYPFFAPGVAKVEEEVPAIYTAAWDAAINKARA
jgi:hypothetical protein